jgi:hypothetical protein
VSAILHTAWDPLAVAGEPGAQGQYDDHVPELVGLLASGASAAKIAARLSVIVRERMGLAGDARHDARVAEMLVKLRAEMSCAGF